MPHEQVGMGMDRPRLGPLTVRLSTQAKLNTESNGLLKQATSPPHVGHKNFKLNLEKEINIILLKLQELGFRRIIFQIEEHNILLTICDS